MKRVTIAFCTAVFLFACNSEEKPADNKTSDTKVASTTSTDNSAKTDEWVAVDSATAMKTMMEVGTPGAEQQMLAKSDGNWKAETSMWMSPDAPPTKGTATVTNKMVLGGRYQESNWKGMMDMGGMQMPFEGTATTGYDKGRKMWVSSWIDNMSTGIMNMEGTWDDATKTATYTGKMLCPANGKWCEMKQTMKMVDDNTQVMEMWGPDMKTGKPYKNMEMKLTRSK